MKAWVIPQHGGLDVLRLEERAVPDISKNPYQKNGGSVLLKVQAVGLNHLDIWVRKGVPGHRFPLPIVPGCDVAGVIEKLSPDAQKNFPALKVGLPVVVDPVFSCGECPACRRDFAPVCVQFGLFGETCDGGCAEHVLVPAAQVVERPASLKTEEAATLPIAYTTAWSMLTRKANLQKGEWALIHAGGSGVSMAAIQFAKLLGARVITTVGSTEKAGKAQELGAEYVVQYREENVKDRVREILKSQGARGVDVVVDHVGAETFSESLKLLNWGGRYVFCGATAESEARFDMKAVFFKNISILGSTMGSHADFRKVVQMAGEGKVRTIIDSVFPFEKYPEAQARLEGRGAFGKVVIKSTH